MNPIGEEYLDALVDLKDARRAIARYDHNADPTGDILTRLYADFNVATERLAKATKALIALA